MGTQNLNNYYFKKVDAKISYDSYYDLFLASDEKDYNAQVVYSTNIIDYEDGDKLPVWIDLNDPLTSNQPTTSCSFQFNTGDTPTYYLDDDYRPFVVLSKNQWSKAKSQCDCPVGQSPRYVPDSFWTDFDNGLNNVGGGGAPITLHDTIPGNPFDIFTYDKRFKMHQVKAFGHAGLNINTFYTDTTILDKQDHSGYYQELCGGFYQGFYKLHGYPYEVLPTRPNKGWSFETYLKLKTIGSSLVGPITNSGQTGGVYGNCYNTSGVNLFGPLQSIPIPGIGDPYQGGIIFYLDGNGGGLISSLVDQAVQSSPGAVWGCDGIDITGAGGIAIGTGLQNTIDILADCTEPGIAAKLCDDYYDGTYDDWFLPSKDELNLMFVNLHQNGLGDFLNLWYWSSTEISNDDAEAMNFNNPVPTFTNGAKTFDGSVRAIRAITPQIGFPSSTSTCCSPVIGNWPAHQLNYSSRDQVGFTVGRTDKYGFFFYKGIRAEDKYFHETTQPSISACTTMTGQTNCCGEDDLEVNLVGENKSPTAEYDVYSNALGFRITDDMRIGYRAIRYTGSCITTGQTCDSGQTHTCGYTIEENYSNQLCEFITKGGDCEDTWIQVDVVFNRNRHLEDCEIHNNGGVNDLVNMDYENRDPKKSNTKTCDEEYPKFVKDAYFDFNCTGSKVGSWFDERESRLGTLIFYINGRRFHTVHDFEEIIPRQLNTNKQTQVGVAYNISWGGGALGLRETLYPTTCDINTTNFINQPQNTDQRLIMENFAGSFIGGISQMMYYIKPLTPDEIYHNFKINKTRYKLIDCEESANCPRCTKDGPDYLWP